MAFLQGAGLYRAMAFLQGAGLYRATKAAKGRRGTVSGAFPCRAGVRRTTQQKGRRRDVGAPVAAMSVRPV